MVKILIIQYSFSLEPFPEKWADLPVSRHSLFIYFFFCIYVRSAVSEVTEECCKRKFYEKRTWYFYDWRKKWISRPIMTFLEGTRDILCISGDGRPWLKRFPVHRNVTLSSEGNQISASHISGPCWRNGRRKLPCGAHMEGSWLSFTYVITTKPLLCVAFAICTKWMHNDLR